MTLCAAHLSTAPTNMQLLLLEYAHRSHEMGSDILLAALTAAAATAGGGEGRDGTNYTAIEHGIRRMLESDSIHNNMNNSEMSLILRERRRSSIHSSSGNNGFPHGLELSSGSSRFIISDHHHPSFNNDEMNRPPTIADCKYIDALLGMPCYLNVNALGIFGNSAEVSLALAALEAVRLYGTVGGGGGAGGMDGEEEGNEAGEDGGYHRYFVPHDCDGRPVLLEETGTKSVRTEGVAPKDGSCGIGSSGNYNNNNITAIITVRQY